MELTAELITGLAIAVLSSPVLIAIVNRKPFKKSQHQLDIVLEKVDNLTLGFDLFQKETALRDFTNKTVRIVNGNSQAVTLEEWINSRAVLSSLIPEEQWPASLKEEVKVARKILMEGGKND